MANISIIPLLCQQMCQNARKVVEECNDANYELQGFKDQLHELENTFSIIEQRIDNITAQMVGLITTLPKQANKIKEQITNTIKDSQTKVKDLFMNRLNCLGEITGKLDDQVNKRRSDIENILAQEIDAIVLLPNQFMDSMNIQIKSVGQQVSETINTFMLNVQDKHLGSVKMQDAMFYVEEQETRIQKVKEQIMKAKKQYVQKLQGIEALIEDTNKKMKLYTEYLNDLDKQETNLKNFLEEKKFFLTKQDDKQNPDLLANIYQKYKTLYTKLEDIAMAQYSSEKQKLENANYELSKFNNDQIPDLMNALEQRCKNIDSLIQDLNHLTLKFQAAQTQHSEQMNDQAHMSQNQINDMIINQQRTHDTSEQLMQRYQQLVDKINNIQYQSNSLSPEQKIVQQLNINRENLHSQIHLIEKGKLLRNINSCKYYIENHPKELQVIQDQLAQQKQYQDIQKQQNKEIKQLCELLDQYKAKCQSNKHLISQHSEGQPDWNLVPRIEQQYHQFIDLVKEECKNDPEIYAKLQTEEFCLLYEDVNKE